MEKGIEFEDLGLFEIRLDRGKKYLIDGELINVDNREKEVIQVKNIDVIRVVTEKEVIKEYKDISTGDIISVDEYYERWNELTKDALSRDYYYGNVEFISTDIDADYNYKKFRLKWTPIRILIQKISEPIKVEVTKIKYNTGCPFINSNYSMGVKIDEALYIYDRKLAVIDIVSKAFKELNMEFVYNANYSETKNKKIWGNSSHSCIRYVIAFGSYLFNNKWDIKYNPRGTLNNMLEMYKSDKEELENIIKTRYILHFEKGLNIDIEDLLKNLINIRDLVQHLEVYRRSVDKKRIILTEINEEIKYIENVSLGKEKKE